MFNVLGGIMASITKLENGYRAEVKRKGIRKVKRFRDKDSATRWALQLEFDIDSGYTDSVEKLHTLSLMNLFEKWEKEVLPGRRCEKWEKLKLKNIKKFPGFKAKLIDNPQRAIREYRDYRLFHETINPNGISGDSVNRELNLISSIITYAIKEWEIGLTENPVKLIRRPEKKEKPRSERWSDQEVALIYKTVGFKYGDKPTRPGHYICYALSLAIETAMRIGEICSLTKADYFKEKRFVHLEHTKNGDQRDVPLSSKAIEILDILAEGKESGQKLMNGTDPDKVAALFRKYKMKAGLSHKHFHDSRHEATTRMAAKVKSVLELSRITGHRNLNMLHTYYNPTATELADLLD